MGADPGAVVAAFAAGLLVALCAAVVLFVQQEKRHARDLAEARAGAGG